MWKGMTEAFILHFLDKIHIYHGLVEPTMHFQPHFQLTLLQNAVNDVDELRAVKSQADQFKTQTGKDIDLLLYHKLLESAAQALDKKLANKRGYAPCCINNMICSPIQTLEKQFLMMKHSTLILMWVPSWPIPRSSAGTTMIMSHLD